MLIGGISKMDDLSNITPYQMFLLHIRSHKTKNEYTKKFEHFFFISCSRDWRKEFQTENVEKNIFFCIGKQEMKVGFSIV